MVVSARLAAGLSGLRNRNARVTNKTVLRVIRGNIDSDSMLLDEDEDEKNKVVASQGVDEEDANEHHLQQALSVYAQRTLSSAQVKGKDADKDVKRAFIPTPDAAGRVSNYEELYLPKRFKDPITHLRFSDSIDECCVGGLSGSFTYFIDERDVEWLAKYNSAVKGEGPSSMPNGGSSMGNVPKNRIPVRHPKGKGKDSDHPNDVLPSSIPITEDEFEVIMGLFEKWTDEQVSPYLHLSSDSQHFPDFNEYQKFLASPLPPSTFATFQPPFYVPSPEKMVQLGQVIYPWWKKRRLERQGHRIVPQLNILVLEAQEKEDRAGSSPYTCFRKRDVKPMRKTRTNNIMHTEKLSRLRSELLNGLELAQMVVEREKIKRDIVQIFHTTWRSRESLAECMKVISVSAPGSVPPTDEQLLFDKERKPRKKAEPGRIILAPARKLSQVRLGSADPHSPLTLNIDMSQAFEECQKWPTARTVGIQREVERELAKLRKDDIFWEDIVDLPFQSSPLQGPDKLFKPIPLNDAMQTRQPNVSQASRPSPIRLGRSARLRTGRGGRVHLDRVMPMGRRQRLLEREWATHPINAPERTTEQEDAERWSLRSWRPQVSRFRRTRVQPDRIDNYLNRPSIYDTFPEVPSSEPENEAGCVLSQQEFLSYGTRRVWTRSRAVREEEGWKPTPYLDVDAQSIGEEAAARNAAERDRIVEEWRGNTLKSAGGALALFTDGRDADHDAHSENAFFIGSSNLERAWRIEQQWRFDSDNRNVQGHDIGNRFILDDFQAKHLRTTATLLETRDHDALVIDPQLTAPMPSKPSRYQDHQVGLHLGPLLLPFASSIPSRQIPITTPSLYTSTSSNGSQSRQIFTSTSTNGNVNHAPTPGGNASSNISSPKPASALVNGGARLPPDSGAVVRTNTPMRTKNSTNGVSIQPPAHNVNINGVMRNDHPVLGKALGVGNIQPKISIQVNGDIHTNGKKNAQTAIAQFSVPQFPQYSQARAT